MIGLAYSASASKRSKSCSALPGTGRRCRREPVPAETGNSRRQGCAGQEPSSSLVSGPCYETRAVVRSHGTVNAQFVRHGIVSEAIA